MIIVCRFNDRPFTGRFSCVGFGWSSVYFDKVLQVPSYFRTAGYIAFMGSIAGGYFMADCWLPNLGLSRWYK
jgi:hypothetical protein